jgi:predicted nuclease of predicted toxin-antitoxin system
VDEQLPPALARWLSAQGHEAWHIVDVGLQGAHDLNVWKHAISVGAVIATKDVDFVERAKLDKRVQVVWVTIGNCRR